MIDFPDALRHTFLYANTLMLIGETLWNTVAHETLTRGWQAELELHFSCTGHKTVLASARHHGPLTVQRPFYPEEDVCHLYLLHPPAGSLAGMSFILPSRSTKTAMR